MCIVTYSNETALIHKYAVAPNRTEEACASCPQGQFTPQRRRNAYTPQNFYKPTKKYFNFF